MLEIMASTASTGAIYPCAVIDPAPEIASGAQGRGEPREADLLQADIPSSVTRELRRPLIAIHGSLRLVAAGALGPLTPEASELLAIAGRSCAELIGLLDDLLGCNPQGGQEPAKPFDPLSYAAQPQAALGLGYR